MNGKLVVVRVNALATAHFTADLEAVVSPALDVLNLPMVEDADTVRHAVTLLEQLERQRGLGPRIGILANIESPRGLRLAAEIAAAHPRMMGLQIGFGDLFSPLGIASGEPSATQAVRVAVRMAAESGAMAAMCLVLVLAGLFPRVAGGQAVAARAAAPNRSASACSPANRPTAAASRPTGAVSISSGKSATARTSGSSSRTGRRAAGARPNVCRSVASSPISIRQSRATGDGWCSAPIVPYRASHVRRRARTCGTRISRADAGASPCSWAARARPAGTTPGSSSASTARSTSAARRLTGAGQNAEDAVDRHGVRRVRALRRRGAVEELAPRRPRRRRASRPRRPRGLPGCRHAQPADRGTGVRHLGVRETR